MKKVLCMKYKDCLSNLIEFSIYVNEQNDYNSLRHTVKNKYDGKLSAGK